MTHLPDELLNEILDEALAPDLRAEAEAHLTACPDCSGRLAELRTLFAEIDSLPDLPLAVDFAPAILARLEKSTPLPRPIRWLAIVQAFGGLLAVVLSWPLIEPLIPPLDFPALNSTFIELAASWLQTSLDFQFPVIAFELPSLGLDLPSTTLTLATLGVALLWLLANGLLLIPRSRRTP